MFKFKGNLLTKWRRYQRWSKLHGYSPLTPENLLSLNVGDRVILIKRNETTDAIALSCGIDGTQPANEIAEWYVSDRTEFTIFLKSVKGDKKSMLNPQLSFFKGFNLILVRPHMFSEEFQLRSYYKRLGV